MIEEALAGRGRRQLGRSLSRWPRTTAEAGYDVVAWTCGMLVAAKALNGPAWHPMTSTDLWYGVTGICAIVAGCGLAAGLYRGRYLRGSRERGHRGRPGGRADRRLPAGHRAGPDGRPARLA